MPSKKSAEISVGLTAARLGVSERSIVNYLKTRRIIGVKVGKKWFIDEASVEAFAKRYGFKIDLNQKEVEVLPSEAEAPFNPKTNPVNPEKSPTPNLQSRENLSSKNLSLSQLHVFQLCLEVFHMEVFNTNKDENLSSLASKCTDHGSRLQSLKNQVLEEIGAGFYSYGLQRKSQHYNNARALVGSILALLYSNMLCSELGEIPLPSNDQFSHKANPKIINQTKAQILELEVKILPAFSSLIRKIERQGQQKSKSNNVKKSFASSDQRSTSMPSPASNPSFIGTL